MAATFGHPAGRFLAASARARRPLGIALFALGGLGGVCARRDARLRRRVAARACCSAASASGSCCRVSPRRAVVAAARALRDRARPSSRCRASSASCSAWRSSSRCSARRARRRWPRSSAAGSYGDRQRARSRRGALHREEAEHGRGSGCSERVGAIARGGHGDLAVGDPAVVRGQQLRDQHPQAAGPASSAAVRSSRRRFWKTPPDRTATSTPCAGGGVSAQALGGRVREGGVEPCAHGRERRVGVEVAQQPRKQGLARVDEAAAPSGPGSITAIGYRSALGQRRGHPLELGGRLALVADPRARRVHRARRRRRRGARRSWWAASLPARGDEARRPAVPAALVDLAGQPARQLRALGVQRRDEPSQAIATARARRRRRRASAPGGGGPTRSKPARSPTGTRRPRSRRPCRSPCRRSHADDRPGGRARPCRRRCGRGGAARPTSPRPRARARSASTGIGWRSWATSWAGPRTGARSARRPRGTSGASRSSPGRRCAGSKGASPLAMQKVFFSCAPQARIGAGADRERMAPGT